MNNTTKFKVYDKLIFFSSVQLIYKLANSIQDIDIDDTEDAMRVAQLIKLTTKYESSISEQSMVSLAG